MSDSNEDQGFLAENWIWILLPFLIVVGGIAAVVLFGGSQDDGAFIYNNF